MGADAGIQTYALDDGLRVQPLDFGVGIEFVEVAHAQGKVGVGEELHGLGFHHPHEQGRDVLLDGSLLEQAGKQPCIFFGLGVGYGTDNEILLAELAVCDLGIPHDDSAGIEVVVECFALAKKFR